MKCKENINPNYSTPPPKFPDDWDKPFTIDELNAIDAAFEAASASATLAPPSSARVVTPPITSSTVDHARPKTRRRLTRSVAPDSGLRRNLGSFALTPHRTTSGFRKGCTKLKHPTMKFGGRIIYCRTIREVDKATLEILELLEAKRRELGRAVLGLDIEWRPTFRRGIPQGMASVMQICGDMTHCYVLHIFHTGIPHNLRSLLEDSSSIKVGVNIGGDVNKVFRDHNVSIKSAEDLSALANQKLGRAPKKWSLSSLVEILTCKQVLDRWLLGLGYQHLAQERVQGLNFPYLLLKPQKIRLGNWEAGVLSKKQLEYAATDAFASWYLYEVLNSLPDPPESPRET